MPSVSPIERVGTYVSPEEWNELISDPETVRTLFECKIHFMYREHKSVYAYVRRCVSGSD